MNNFLILCNHYNILSRRIFTLITPHFFTFAKLIFPKFSPVQYILSHSTNSNITSVSFSDVCNLSFETRKGLYRHQSYDPKHKKLSEKMFDLRRSFTNADLDEAITEASAKSEASTKTI